MVNQSSLPYHNLFSSLPTTPPAADSATINLHLPPAPTIPIPKYPPKSQKYRKPSPQNPSKPHPTFKIPHRTTKYYKPIRKDRERLISPGGDRAVIIGESGVSYLLPGSPFVFQFS
ncbi:hypothetical protein Nepgr_029489 [Nepenthes gracilis]|uniref:Uncharacterized protein n=1 Tax=Nepenthes gracilis TaxID=150966 RepID=A0AAD3Y5L2_NEPGR|nr:hypothetical protein Nepgr_029489 [Nepenthes gracilis]